MRSKVGVDICSQVVGDLLLKRVDDEDEEDTGVSDDELIPGPDESDGLDLLNTLEVIRVDGLAILCITVDILPTLKDTLVVCVNIVLWLLLHPFMDMVDWLGR